MNPTPEVRILLAVSKWSHTPEDRDRLALWVRENLDWDRLIDMAEGHGLLGLLHHRLAGVDLADEVKNRLRSGFAKTWAETLASMSALPPVLDSLGERGIPVVLLKGVDLVETLYEDPGLRPLSDVDLLVRLEDFERTRKALTGLGFEPWEDHEEHFEKDSLVIELHTSLIDVERIGGRRHTPHLETEAVWARAQSGEGGPPYILRLAAEDHLLYLCRHLLQHSYEGLIWFTDIAGFIRTHERTIDWEVLFERARETALHSCLIFVLRFLEGTLGESLPAPALQELAATPRGRMEGWLLERLSLRLDIGPLSNLLLISTIGKFTDRVAFLRESCFPRDDVMRQIYPSYRPGRRAWFCLFRGFQLAALGAWTGLRFLLPERPPRSM